MSKKERNVLFKIEYTRTAEMISDFVKFTYRQRFPKVTRNFLIIGLLALIFIYGGKLRAVQLICLIVGVFCIFMAFFRHHIPISAMKKRDPDFINQNTLTYEFTGHDITGLRNEEIYIHVNDYHRIHHVYHDEKYFYLGLNDEDLIILPKDSFKLGKAEEFEDYIKRKTGIEPGWLPASREARKEQGRKDRAARAAKAEEMQKERMEEMVRQRAEMKEAFQKAREARKAKKDAEKDVTEK